GAAPLASPMAPADPVTAEVPPPICTFEQAVKPANATASGSTFMVVLHVAAAAAYCVPGEAYALFASQHEACAARRQHSSDNFSSVAYDPPLEIVRLKSGRSLYPTDVSQSNGTIGAIVLAGHPKAAACE